MQDAEQQMLCQDCWLSPAAVCTECGLPAACTACLQTLVGGLGCNIGKFPGITVRQPRECQALSVIDVSWVVIEFRALSELPSTTSPTETANE
jgi:hypothetical protein